MRIQNTPVCKASILAHHSPYKSLRFHVITREIPGFVGRGFNLVYNLNGTEETVAAY